MTTLDAQNFRAAVLALVQWRADPHIGSRHHAEWALAQLSEERRSRAVQAAVRRIESLNRRTTCT